MNRILTLLIIITQSCTMEKQMSKEPKAKKIDTILSNHGYDRVDSYYWMSERDNPDVLNYLNQEPQNCTILLLSGYFALQFL